MSLLAKASNKLVTICGIEIATSGDVKVSNIADWQPFYNSIIENANFEKVYIGYGSVTFAEQSTKTNAGTQYKQKLEFRFPSNDPYRAQRIAFFEKTKFIRVLLTNGKSLLIGRNDFNQNARPKVIVKSNQHLTEVEIQTVSIFPTGFTPGSSSFGLPSLIPFTLIPTS